MRFKLPAGLLSSTLTVCAVASLLAQASQPQQPQDDQRVIEDFVTTRGAGFGERPNTSRPSTNPTPRPQGNKNSAGVASSKRPPRNRTKPGNTDVAGKGAKGSSKSGKGTTATGVTGAASDDAGDASVVDASAVNAPATANAIGLGYTIVTGDGTGQMSVVDSSRQFVAGDKIRILLETNSDGFLYIFNVENDRAQPILLYPHAALDGGANKIAAHARDFFPADLRYSFEFDDNPATEHLYIIFSRRPLPDVPAGASLLEHCGGAREDCYWKPTPEQWERIKIAATDRAVESYNKDLAKMQNPLPSGSLSRGIQVKKDEPAPAVVRMNISSASDTLLTKIELVHK